MSNAAPFRKLKFATCCESGFSEKTSECIARTYKREGVTISSDFGHLPHAQVRELRLDH
jgi:hypothetical protein